MPEIENKYIKQFWNSTHATNNDNNKSEGGGLGKQQ
jgi:hypothetical protein